MPQSRIDTGFALVQSYGAISTLARAFYAPRACMFNPTDFLARLTRHAQNLRPVSSGQEIGKGLKSLWCECYNIDLLPPTLAVKKNRRLRVYFSALSSFNTIA